MPSRIGGDGALLQVRVQPRSARNEVVDWQGPVLRVRVTAAPEDGRANRAVVELLAEAFRVPRSAVALVRGARARDKLFSVQRLPLEILRARLEPGRRP